MSDSPAARLERPYEFPDSVAADLASRSPRGPRKRPACASTTTRFEAELDPHLHQITARAKVKFTALQDLSVAVFELHNDLRVTKVLDEKNQPLSAERVTQDSTVRVPLPAGLAKDASTTLTFEYEGQLETGDNSPVPGLKLAYIGDDTSYLLYAGRWFPVSGFGLNRFTSTISVTVPAHMLVIGSGKSHRSLTLRHRRSRMPASCPPRPSPSFPTSPVFPEPSSPEFFRNTRATKPAWTCTSYFKPTHQSLAPAYTTTAVQEFTYFITLYGLPPSQKLNVVELPGDTVPYAWAPEIAGLAGPSITEKTNYRLLADAIAHQWWGVSVSPATKDDWWLSDGFSRYSEAMYVENAAGAAGLEEAVKDMSVGALAYDTVPLSSASKLDIFSTEFQSLATDKGAMILHMLRWVLGEDKYNKTMRDFASRVRRQIGQHGRLQRHRREKLRRPAHLVLLAVARFDRRARIQGEVHHLPPGRQRRGKEEETKEQAKEDTSPASASPARFRRISICSACRWISESTPTAKPKTSASKSWARIRRSPSRPSDVRAASRSIPTTTC